MLDIIVVRELKNNNISYIGYVSRDNFVSYKEEFEFMQKIYDALTLNYCPNHHEFIIGMANIIDDFLLEVKKTPKPQRYDLN